MQKDYVLMVKYMKPGEDRISVTVGVDHAQLLGISVFQVEVGIERVVGEAVEYYEAEAIKKAKNLICGVSESIQIAA